MGLEKNMKLILIAGTDENLNKIAAKLKTASDEIAILSDYLVDEDELRSLQSKTENYGEIIILSDTLYGMVNSCLIKLIEALNGQKLTLNKIITFILYADNQTSLAEKYLNEAGKSLNLNLGGIFIIKAPKNTLTAELDLYEQIFTVGTKLVERESKSQAISGKVIIYTDGACSGNPGAGGWGAVLIHGEKKREISGFDPITTNNKMELTAVIKALSELKKPCKVELYSDSAYVVNAITQNWLNGWKNNGWLGSDKKPVKNQDLWKELDALINKHEVNFNKVKGHSDNELNNRCDALATGEIAKHANEE